MPLGMCSGIRVPKSRMRFLSTTPYSQKTTYPRQCHNNQSLKNELSLYENRIKNINKMLRNVNELLLRYHECYTN